jgi:hypothetical protein
MQQMTAHKEKQVGAHTVPLAVIWVPTEFDDF